VKLLAANSILRASGSRVNSTFNRRDNSFNRIKAGTRLYARRVWPQKGRVHTKAAVRKIEITGHSVSSPVNKPNPSQSRLLIGWMGTNNESRYTG
jgi:hypothetical protein